MMTKAFITGLQGPELSADERAFLADERPWGLILFARNCDTAEQIRHLTAAFREAVGRADAPVLIDQEGGRVQRLRPPICRAYPPGRVYGTLFDRETELGRRAAWLGARLIADDLLGLGITVDCLPVLDVPVAGSHDVIGDRAYADQPDRVAAIGWAASEGLLAGGVLPVIKHIPGHGRAGADSHLELPRVDSNLEELRALDFVPFHTHADRPLAMTAHVVYSAIDPDLPATTSPRVIGDFIRGEIGFTGCLMSDDLSMRALKGTLTERTRAVFTAGCDIALYCSGVFSEMRDVAAATPELDGLAAARTKAALGLICAPEPLDRQSLEGEFDDLMAAAGWTGEIGKGPAIGMDAH